MNAGSACAHTCTLAGAPQAGGQSEVVMPEEKIRMTKESGSESEEDGGDGDAK